MMTDKTIFGIRSDSDEDIQPSPEELVAFLEHANKEGGEDLPIGDLADYRWLITDVEVHEDRQALDESEQDLSRKMSFGVLQHTQFASPVLLSEVELYAYHLHTLSLLDFKNPASFIKSAEHEMSRLSPKRINDVMRMGRLQEMIAERKKILTKLKSQFKAITPELRRIALYVRENLIKIEKICEASAVIIAETDSSRVKEKQVVEEVRTHLKEVLKEAVHHGKITRQNLDKVRDEVDLISMEMPYLFSTDSEALTKLYETIHDHVKKSAQDIATVLADMESKKTGSVQENFELLRQLGRVLVSLLSNYRMEIKPCPEGPITPRDRIINEKRAEMIDYLFEQVRKERRALKERRRQPDRRKALDPAYKGPERRSGRDRRSGKGRRS
jgi:predicted hydrocarbon binding protein